MQFDATVIDLDSRLFAANLLYVAITRTKTLEGLTFVGRLLAKADFQVHQSKLAEINVECSRVDALVGPTLEIVRQIVDEFYPDLVQFFGDCFDE